MFFRNSLKNFRVLLCCVLMQFVFLSDVVAQESVAIENNGVMPGDLTGEVLIELPPPSSEEDLAKVSPQALRLRARNWSSHLGDSAVSGARHVSPVWTRPDIMSSPIPSSEMVEVKPKQFEQKITDPKTRYTRWQFANWNFPREALTFYMAVGVMSFFECSLKVLSHNPMACSQFLHELQTPVSWGSFGGFVFANHFTTHFFNPHRRIEAGVRPGVLKPLYGTVNINEVKPNDPRVLGRVGDKAVVEKLNPSLRYMGLAAGVLVSRFLTNLYMDPNITYIRKHMFEDRQNWTAVDQERWDRAWDNAYRDWTTAMLKGDFVPPVLSVMSSMGAATITANIFSESRKAVMATRGGQALARGGQTVTGALSTTRFIRPAAGVVQTVAGGLHPLALMGKSVLGIIHFLAWDKYVFTPFFHKQWSLGTSSARMRSVENNIAGFLDIAHQRLDRGQLTNDVLIDVEPLQNHIRDWNMAVADYRLGLGQNIQTTFQNWQAFFQAFNTQKDAAYYFYKDVIENKGLEFRADHQGRDRFGRSWRSKGMLDAWHFGSRGLSQSIRVTANRLHLESQLLQAGLKLEILDRYADSQLREIIRVIDGQPSSEDLDLVEYLNLGLPFRHDFTEFDYQIRTKAFYLGIAPQILNEFEREHTPYIHEFVDFLEEQPLAHQAVYVVMANERHDWTNRNYNDLLHTLQSYFDGFTESHLKSLQDNEGKCKIGLRISHSQSLQDLQDNYFACRGQLETLKMQASNGQLHQPGQYFDEDYGKTVLRHKRHSGIAFHSTAEKLLIGMVCGKSPEELGSDIFYRGGGLGALTFEPPRLFKDRPSFCDNLSNVHQAFSVSQNGREVSYQHLLDYVSNNIENEGITVESFQRGFWGMDSNEMILPQEDLEKTPQFEVTELLAEIEDTYLKEEQQAFHENMTRAFHKISDSPSHAASNISGFIAHTHFTDVKTYPRGIHQFEQNLTDDYLDVLYEVLQIASQNDTDFLSSIAQDMDALRDLAHYTGRQYDDLKTTQNGNVHIEYEQFILSSQAYCVQDLADQQDFSPEELQKEIRETLESEEYQYIVHCRLLDLNQKVDDYLKEYSGTSIERLAVLGLTSQLLGGVQQSLNYSAMIEGWLPQTQE